jgi:hypothetical protein
VPGRLLVFILRISGYRNQVNTLKLGILPYGPGDAIAIHPRRCNITEHNIRFEAFRDYETLHSVVGYFDSMTASLRGMDRI